MFASTIDTNEDKSYPNQAEAIALLKKCGGDCKANDWNGEWTRIFVTTPDGIQIGRLTFQWQELKYVKSYKKDYHQDIDVTDWIFYRFNKAIATRGKTILSMAEFSSLWLKAITQDRLDLKTRKQWRIDNPNVKEVTLKNGTKELKDCRKALRKRNSRLTLARLVRDYNQV